MPDPQNDPSSSGQHRGGDEGATRPRPAATSAPHMHGYLPQPQQQRQPQQQWRQQQQQQQQLQQYFYHQMSQQQQVQYAAPRTLPPFVLASAHTSGAGSSSSGAVQAAVQLAPAATPAEADSPGLEPPNEPSSGAASTGTGGPNREAEGRSSSAPRQAPSRSRSKEKDRQPCAFFLKTGSCAYGHRCKFEHPYDKAPRVAYNSLGLPLRPGEPTCAFYVKHFKCAFGHTCKFSHPELPPAVHAMMYVPRANAGYNMQYSQVQYISPSHAPNVQHMGTPYYSMGYTIAAAAAAAANAAGTAEAAAERALVLPARLHSVTRAQHPRPSAVAERVAN